jgi:hypothetical protein
MKCIKHCLIVAAETWEILLFLPGCSFLYWLFALLGHLPQVELSTNIYIGLWADVMYVVGYETVRAAIVHFKEGATAR